MSDTPRTDAIASEMEHLGPGGRALYQGRLWSLAYALEAELTAARAECDALRDDIAMLRECVSAVSADRDRLRAECDALLEAGKRVLKAYDNCDKWQMVVAIADTLRAAIDAEREGDRDD